MVMMNVVPLAVLPLRPLQTLLTSLEVCSAWMHKASVLVMCLCLMLASAFSLLFLSALKHRSLLSDSTFNCKLLLIYFFKFVVQVIKKYGLKLMFPCFSRQWILYLNMDLGPDMESPKLNVFSYGQFTRLNCISVFTYTASRLWNCVV